MGWRGSRVKETQEELGEYKCVQVGTKEGTRTGTKEVQVGTNEVQVGINEVQVGKNEVFRHKCGTSGYKIQMRHKGVW